MTRYTRQRSIQARDTVEKMIAADGLFRNVNGHLDTSVNSEVPGMTRQCMSMTCLQVFEQVFLLFEGSQTVRWYELGVGRRLYQQCRVLLGDGR